ncbi:MAG: cell wall-active antibiotics response protein [bacterium]|nr:cell wall-active antibiotics response protein [bacterium]
MSNRTILFGFVLIVIGMVFLGRSLDIFDFGIGDLFSMVLPVGFILIGLWLIVRRKESAKAHQWHPPGEEPSSEAWSASRAGATTSGQTTASSAESSVPPPPPPGPPPGESTNEGARLSDAPQYGPSGKLKFDKFVGDMYIDCSNVNLQNIEIGMFVGDIEIKLHGGNLAPGLNRMVISGFVSDVRILIPREMAVYIQTSNFIGDIELMGRTTSGFGNNLDAQTPNYQAAESKLYIASNQFVGDVRAYIV